MRFCGRGEGNQVDRTTGVIGYIEGKEDLLLIKIRAGDSRREILIIYGVSSEGTTPSACMWMNKRPCGYRGPTNQRRRKTDGAFKKKKCTLSFFSKRWGAGAPASTTLLPECIDHTPNAPLATAKSEENN